LCYRIFTFNGIVIINEVSNACHWFCFRR
jgi:hypothetical protein